MFAKVMGARNGFIALDEVLGYYSYKRIFSKLITALGRRLAPKLASLFTYHYWGSAEEAFLLMDSIGDQCLVSH